MGKKKNSKKVTTSEAYVYEPCHTGNVLVTETPIPVFGFGGTREGKAFANTIIIDCADQVSVSSLKTYGITLPDNLQQLAMNPYQVIKIDWSDGGVPSLSAEFWKELAAYLVEQGKAVHICCMGGHGRTGTALACLLYFMGVTKDLKGQVYDPVDFVRWKYCEKSVETWSQIDYIERITGISSDCKPTWHVTTTSKWCSWCKSNVCSCDDKYLDSSGKEREACPECGFYFSCANSCSIGRVYGKGESDTDQKTIWCMVCQHEPCECDDAYCDVCQEYPCQCKQGNTEYCYKCSKFKCDCELSEQELADKELDEYLQGQYGRGKPWLKTGL